MRDAAMGRGWLGVWIALALLVTSADGTAFSCPDGQVRTRSSTQFQDFPLMIGVHEQEGGIGRQRCFANCQRNRMCLLAHFDSSANRKGCVYSLASTDNLKAFCKDFVRKYERSNAYGEFRCGKRGCRVLEKFCPACADASLDLLVSVAKCHGRNAMLHSTCADMTGSAAEIESLTGTPKPTKSIEEPRGRRPRILIELPRRPSSPKLRSLPRRQHKAVGRAGGAWVPAHLRPSTRPPSTTRLTTRSTSTTTALTRTTTTAPSTRRPSTAGPLRPLTPQVLSVEISDEIDAESYEKLRSFCGVWAADGQCEANPSYMCEECVSECGARCGPRAVQESLVCQDREDNCVYWARFCSSLSYIQDLCRETCGFC